MRVKAHEMEEKLKYVGTLLEGYPGIKDSDINRKVKKRFSNGISAVKIKEVRNAAMIAKHGTKAVSDMKKIGRERRLKEAREPDEIGVIISADAVEGELLQDKQLQDCASIVLKRVPGIKNFHLTVVDGKAKLEYAITTEKTGKIKI